MPPTRGISPSSPAKMPPTNCIRCGSSIYGRPPSMVPPLPLIPQHDPGVLYQSEMRVVQGMKEQASKCDSSSIKSLRYCACSSSSSKQARRFSGSVDSSAYKTAKNDKYKQAEESLRTVMFLSFWGPN
ncbi:hypothetical protein SADUNF_Sadunf11G0023000 [Salix dunnii]|uniref:Uncharacterized protein n=1 Tax=Salix dunnii TaxID=1413687 RepID=A0A835MSW6_9ROSI|nr:hypothetical protein SADUNF_Sadunf11G0023000 [Salix dunnii]